MSVVYNGTTIDKIVYNGVEIFGSNMKKVVLWTNPSNNGFNQQTITILNISSYKYIGITYYPYTTMTSQYATTIFSIDDFRKLTSKANTFYGMLTGCIEDGQQRYRKFYYISDTSIKIDNAYDFSGVIRPAALIPYQVIGLK